jgi:hypothetical protein
MRSFGAVESGDFITTDLGSGAGEHNAWHEIHGSMTYPGDVGKPLEDTEHVLA